MARFPVPENNISFTISTAYPLAVRGKPNLARVTSNGMTCKPLFAILTEVVCTINEYLIIKRLCSKILV